MGFGGGIEQALGELVSQIGNQGKIPRPQAQSIQRPQLNQIPQLLPTPPGFNPMAGTGGAQPGQMPFIRNAAMSQVLSPLMQQNYGLPVVSPFGQQQAMPRIGQPFPGLNVPGMATWGPAPRAFSW